MATITKTTKKIILITLCILALIIIAGCGSETKLAASNGQNCIDCHTNKDKLAADLKANPLPKKEKSAETSGEG